MKYNKKAVILAEKNGVLSTLRKQMIIHEIRKVYDQNDELAILRQASDKPEEYAEYYTYVEECKTAVNNFITEIIG